MNIWTVLGISPTSDESVIRRAYAKKAKEYHPEEHPEEFRMLNEAYRKAIASANQLNTVWMAHTKQNTQERQIASETPLRFTGDSSDATQIDDSIIQRYNYSVYATYESDTFGAPYEQLCQSALKEIRRMFTNKVNRKQAWQSFLQSEMFMSVMHEPEFIILLTEFFSEIHYNIRPSVYIQIQNAYVYSEQCYPDAPPYTQLFNKIYIRKRQAILAPRKPNVKVIIAVCILPLLFVAALTVLFMPKKNNEIKADEQFVPTHESMLLKMEDTILYQINAHLDHNYPDVHIVVNSDYTSMELCRVYDCALPEYADMQFHIYSIPSIGFIYDDMMAAAVTQSIKTLGFGAAYNDSNRNVFIPYANVEELEEICGILMRLPQACVEDYPFLENAEINVSILPAETPYTYADVSPRMVFDNDDGWLSDRSATLNILQNMYNAYIVDYTPWQAADIPEEWVSRHLEGGSPTTVFTGNGVRELADVRIQDGHISSGNIYRLCMALEIPIDPRGDGVLIVTEKENEIEILPQGTAAVSDISMSLGVDVQ